MKLLVVRRDNIGDLVCTTPLLAALRKAKPGAWIGALVNSYNAPVLERNPHVDAVVAYRKLKHLAPGESALGALRERIVSLWRLREEKLDAVLLATPGQATRGLRLARWLAPKAIAGFDDGSAAARRLDLRVPRGDLERRHEVEHVMALARLFGAEADTFPRLVLEPDPREVEAARASLASRPGRKVAVHISARRARQRWPAERFVALLGALADQGASPVLLWSPGPAGHPQHPGDDEKAAGIAAALGARRVLAWPTPRLANLIGMLAACETVICPDGGAMHLAAALQKPVVALFGDSPVARWRPWGVPHRVLTAPSRDVADLSVEQVLLADEALAAPA